MDKTNKNRIKDVVIQTKDQQKGKFFNQKRRKKRADPKRARDAKGSPAAMDAAAAEAAMVAENRP